MKRYFLLYKPYQVLCQFSPSENKKTLADICSLPKDVYPVGRLDEDSEGLLLLTNDKALTNRLLHPSYEHRRSYYVQVDGEITSDAINRLKSGVDIKVHDKMYHTLPCDVLRCARDPELPPRVPSVRFRKNVPTSWISMELTEGKNRQVRKMCASVGFPVLRLVRFRISNIELRNMQPGDLIEINYSFIRKKILNE